MGIKKRDLDSKQEADEKIIERLNNSKKYLFIGVNKKNNNLNINYIPISNFEEENYTVLQDFKSDLDIIELYIIHSKIIRSLIRQEKEFKAFPKIEKLSKMDIKKWDQFRKKIIEKFKIFLKKKDLKTE